MIIVACVLIVPRGNLGGPAGEVRVIVGNRLMRKRSRKLDAFARGTIVIMEKARHTVASFHQGAPFGRNVIRPTFPVDFEFEAPSALNALPFTVPLDTDNLHCPGRTSAGSEREHDHDPSIGPTCHGVA
jgi:hypothetical protein